MRLLKIILLIFCLSLESCGYNSIYSQNKNGENINFGFTELKIIGDNDLVKDLERSLERYKNLSGKTKTFTIDISTGSTRETVLKDTAGNATIYSLFVEATLTVGEFGKKEKKRRRFLKKFRYNNDSNKFNLKKYESSIKRNLIVEISRDIVQYLSYIK